MLAEGPIIPTEMMMMMMMMMMIIIIIIVFINCNWVVTRWQWLSYTYTNMKKM